MPARVGACGRSRGSSGSEVFRWRSVWRTRDEISACESPARFGRLAFDGDRVIDFSEKPESGEGWINGGFFVLSPDVLDFIESDDTSFELRPIERLSREGQLLGFRHHGYWSCMDTLKEKRTLEDIWASGDAPWKIWP